jgi:hypothetical protein
MSHKTFTLGELRRLLPLAETSCHYVLKAELVPHLAPGAGAGSRHRFTLEQAARYALAVLLVHAGVPLLSTQRCIDLIMAMSFGAKLPDPGALAIIADGKYLRCKPGGRNAHDENLWWDIREARYVRFDGTAITTTTLNFSNIYRTLWLAD